MSTAALALNSCPACGAVTSFTLPSGRRIILVSSRFAIGPRLIVDCVVCGGCTVAADGEIRRRGLWVPGPGEIADLLHRAYPEVRNSTTLYLAPEDRRLGTRAREGVA